jgi:hypothetical protein
VAAASDPQGPNERRHLGGLMTLLIAPCSRNRYDLQAQPSSIGWRHR